MDREIIFPTEESPKRLENFLKKRFPIGYVRKLFRKSGVRLNGKRPKPEELARPGDRIQLYLPFEKRSSGVAKRISKPFDLSILFEDDELLLVNKPAGLAVHEGKELLKRYSLLGRLEESYRSRQIRPRLVHRLDRDTSGILLVAKDEKIQAALEGLFESESIDKRYLTLVVGSPQPAEGKIDLPLPGRDGKPARAVTRYRVEKTFSETSLVRADPDTGRMHQIRLHFARFGHPVVMDDSYGNFSFNKRFRKAYGLKRQFLHASSLAFEHHGTRRRWTAPLPDDLRRILDTLGSDYPRG